MMRRSLIVSRAAAVVLAGCTSTNAAAGDVALYLVPRGYIATQYTVIDASSSDYVYFVAEDIGFDVVFKNSGAEHVWLRPSSVSPEQSVVMSLYRKQSGNSAEVPAPVRYDPEAVVTGPGQQLRAQWSRRLELAPRSAIALSGTFPATASLTPGTYQLKMSSIAVECEPDCNLRRQAGTVRFEVRDPKSIPERLDMLLRRGKAAIRSGDYEGASRAANEMLAVYPMSAVAHQVRGESADARSDAAAALAAYQTALARLHSGQDALYITANRNRIYELTEYLKAAISRVRNNESAER